MADKFKAFLENSETELDKVEALRKAEEATGVPKLYLVAAAAVLVVSILYFGFGAGFFVNLVGFAYPAYQSLKAIESGETVHDVQWLVYWVIYSAFSIVETFSETVLSWIPFYFPFKCAFLAYCFLPQTEGAKVIYDHFLHDFLKKHESAISSELKNSAKSD